MENDSEQPTLSPSTKYSDELSIVFGNISGLNAKKRSKLRTLTKHDHLICLNETNLSQNDSILLTDSGLGNTAVIKALDNISFNRGKRTVPTRNGQASRNTMVMVQPLYLSSLTTPYLSLVSMRKSLFQLF